MNLILLSGLMFILALEPGNPDCDNLKLSVTVTHTSEGKSNGKLEVIVDQGKAPFKVFLFAANPKVNLVDIKLKDLKDLPAAEYLLIVQDKSNCRIEQTVIVK